MLIDPLLVAVRQRFLNSRHRGSCDTSMVDSPVRTVTLQGVPVPSTRTVMWNRLEVQSWGTVFQYAVRVQPSGQVVVSIRRGCSLGGTVFRDSVLSPTGWWCLEWGPKNRGV